MILLHPFFLFFCCTWSSLLNTAHANVEKTIFIAPPPSTVRANLADVALVKLSPQRPVLSTHLNATFPTPESPYGADTWLFLQRLNPGQRYEVRVCWLATQPTSFLISTFPVSTVVEDPALLSSVSRFALSSATEQQPALGPGSDDDSVLFLRIRAAADYYSLDRSLMKRVPPVAVDVILDPFLWNVFPRSLVPTAVYIIAVAAFAVILARWIYAQFESLVRQAAAEDLVEKSDAKKRL